MAAELSEYMKNNDLDNTFREIEDLVKESREGAQRVKEIVENLRFFSRPGEKKPAMADLNAGIERTLSVIGNELRYKAKVHKDLKTLPLIRCYPQELNQVFLNIIINASQSISRQGDIWIRSGLENGTIRIEVEDNGEGITEDIRQKIFEPFFSLKEVGQGTGLGLAISYGIVRRHGGHIELESEPGKGSRFTVVLPDKGLHYEERSEFTNIHKEYSDTVAATTGEYA